VFGGVRVNLNLAGAPDPRRCSKRRGRSPTAHAIRETCRRPRVRRGVGHRRHGARCDCVAPPT
jgi:hypothetical protein